MKTYMNTKRNPLQSNFRRWMNGNAKELTETFQEFCKETGIEKTQHEFYEFCKCQYEIEKGYIQ